MSETNTYNVETLTYNEKEQSVSKFYKPTPPTPAAPKSFDPCTNIMDPCHPRQNFRPTSFFEPHHPRQNLTCSYIY